MIDALLSAFITIVSGPSILFLIAGVIIGLDRWGYSRVWGNRWFISSIAICFWNGANLWNSNDDGIIICRSHI